VRLGVCEYNDRKSKVMKKTNVFTLLLWRCCNPIVWDMLDTRSLGYYNAPDSS
jgi:hypothetical protein